MTETDLNEALSQIEGRRQALLPAAPVRRTGRAYRREMRARKEQRLLRQITRAYMPHAGYVDCDFPGGDLLQSGFYIKYPKDSRAQRYLKRRTSHRAGRAELPAKGNAYRKLAEYWWDLY